MAIAVALAAQKSALAQTPVTDASAWQGKWHSSETVEATDEKITGHLSIHDCQNYGCKIEVENGSAQGACSFAGHIKLVSNSKATAQDGTCKLTLKLYHQRIDIDDNDACSDSCGAVVSGFGFGEGYRRKSSK